MPLASEPCSVATLETSVLRATDYGSVTAFWGVFSSDQPMKAAARFRDSEEDSLVVSSDLVTSLA